MARFANILCKILFLIVITIFSLGAIALFRALILIKDPVIEPCITTDEDYISNSLGLAKRLSEAIKFKTISYTEHVYNNEELQKFITFITKSFPLIHSSPLVERTVVNNLSLLYYIQGSNTLLKPYLLAGHMDVVPVEESQWSVPPFSGVIKDDHIWGRGTLDCKHIVMGSLEALEFLLAKGYQPKRSFYLAFGHDEEVHGLDGAQYISKLLKSRNVELEYILDEGSVVFDNFIPGIKVPVGLVSVSEKGSLDLELNVHSVPTHSSFPNKETAIVILAKALSKMEGDMFPSLFGYGPEDLMFEELASCASLPFKIILRNLWLFRNAIIMYMSDPVMSAFHRTTTAVTIVSSGNKINVLPSIATAKVNLRIHPAQTIEEALNYVKKVINDNRVVVKILSQTSPHPISPMDSFGYFAIKKSIRQIFKDSCVAPMTLIANTDTRWYLDLSKSIYRFSLIRMFPNETSRFHGHNERIHIDNYVQIVNFFLHLIKNSDETSLLNKHTHSEL